MLTFSRLIWWINFGLAILFLVTYSGGGVGGTGFYSNVDGNVLTKSLVIENETLSVSYNLGPEDNQTNFAGFSGYASNVGDDIILALQQTHDPNFRCEYEIKYTTLNK